MAVVHKTKTRSILLRGVEHTISKELIAGGTITPGHLLSINSSGAYVVHATAGGRALKVFATERDFVGDDIDTNYVANDFVQARVCRPGVEINALVAASAAAVVIGDFLESAGDGTLRKLTAPLADATGTADGTVADVTGVFDQTILNNNFKDLVAAINATEGAIAMALEAVDNSGGASPARLRVILL